MNADPKTLHSLLADAPNRWGRWGPNDEIGALNFLGEREVRQGLAAIRQARTFTLGVPIATDRGDPVFPGRWPARHFMVADKAGFTAGHWHPLHGGLEFADDYVTGFAQAGTHCDALGHMWFDDTLWNGYPAASTNGGMTKAGIMPIAERGIVGRGVLLDIARFRGKAALGRGETITHHDLVECARAQGVEILPRSILMVRTGWVGALLGGRETITDTYWEPGLTFSLDLVRWFDAMEIPCLVTDTLANETTYEPDTGMMLVLHAALMRNLGIVFTEMAWLDDLAERAAADRQFDGLFCGSPAKVSKGTGGSINPVFIR
ncbi:metal-dependent hydrolase [Kaistia algarum]|uniref:cyclase family protein n=1 Tax=Kaistia algarum TaxID=2083279 RepID=UPI000CE92406|nr:cyclase family protein [Kaistia algarum]MCX5515789.1 cyclase family protein [Kaistia algarum]PPE80836.1 metal-dependent hydrolase [Kaistia algarum]